MLALFGLFDWFGSTLEPCAVSTVCNQSRYYGYSLDYHLCTSSVAVRITTYGVRYCTCTAEYGVFRAK